MIGTASALLVYFILAANGRWEFLTTTRINDIDGDPMTYCMELRDSLNRKNTGAVGNIRAECSIDKEVAL